MVIRCGDGCGRLEGLLCEGDCLCNGCVTWITPTATGYPFCLLEPRTCPVEKKPSRRRPGSQLIFKHMPSTERAGLHSGVL